MDSVLCDFLGHAQELEAYLDSRTCYTKGTVEELLMTISKFELLTPEEETEAIKKALDGDREALESLIAANMRYCVSIANQYQHRGLDLMQLIRIAERSIPRSVMSFDPRKGVSFAGHAVKGMRSEILSELGM